MKKILVVITTSFIREGGLTSVIMNYYRVMNKQELRIDFASTNLIKNDLQVELENNNSSYHQLPKRSNIYKYVNSLKKLASNYNIIHIHGNSATTSIELFAAALANVPKRIVHIHSSNTDYPILNKLLKPLFNKLYTEGIAVSDVSGNWIFGKKKFILLNNAIDVKKYMFNNEIRIKYRNNLSINDDTCIFGHIGKMMNAKNHIFLLYIFKDILNIMPSSKLLLIGDGELRKDIEKMIVKLNISSNVIILGMRSDIPQLLQVMDVFIFPSLWEGLPLSVLEAQASGLPCFISSSISDNVKMTPFIQSISLDLPTTDWSEIITSYIINTQVERGKNSDIAYKNMIENKYEIHTTSKELEKIYNS